MGKFRNAITPKPIDHASCHQESIMSLADEQRFQDNFSCLLLSTPVTFFDSLVFSEEKRYREKKEKLISPLPRGGRRMSSSAFLSRRPFFGYYLPIASYGIIFAAKWPSNGGLEAVVSK